jgi:RNA polymerase sigma-70 factor (ECF subfamily)
MDDHDELTSVALRARRGDAAAAAAFVRATQADVWRLCAHLGSAATADDLTQETYARAFASLHRFLGRSSARTWLLSIARRTAAPGRGTGCHRGRTGWRDRHRSPGDRRRTGR